MFKIKSLMASVLCICLLSSSFQIANAKDTNLQSATVYLTGSGIAARLHEPVLKEFSDVSSRVIRIPEESMDNDELNISPEDWLFLGTPVYKHEKHLLYATKKYKKILCEKPVGLSLDEIDQIKHAINENQVLFRVNYALRFLPVLDEIKEFINNNDIKSVTLTCNASFNKNPPNKDWKNDYKLGGGILYSIFPHLADLLNFVVGQSNLDSITYESNQEIPMDDIKFRSKTLNGVDTAISINLCENFDELALKIETADKTEVFDLINSSDNKIAGTKYCNGTLPATSELSPWRTSFRMMLKNMFINPEDCRFARIEDAENVHKILSVILSQLPE